MDPITNIKTFLRDKTGSSWGLWRGRMTKAEQITLFGRYIGKGTIIIDGMYDTVLNRVKVCFGLDYDDRNITLWRDL